MVWIYVIGGIAALVIAFIVFVVVINIIEERKEKKVREQGETVAAWIVQSNDPFPEEPTFRYPAQVLFTFSQDTRVTNDWMMDLVSRMCVLKDGRRSNAVEEFVGGLIADETMRSGVRVPLPLEFTDGIEVFSGHMWIEKNRFEGGRLPLPFVYCKAISADKGPRDLYMIDYPE